jgi:lipoprotein
MKAWKNFLLLTLTVCLVFAVGCAKADPTAHPSPSTDIGSGDPDVQYRYEIKGACDFFVGSEATADSLDYSNVKAVRLNSNGVEYPVEADFSAVEWGKRGKYPCFYFCAQSKVERYVYIYDQTPPVIEGAASQTVPLDAQLSAGVTAVDQFGFSVVIGYTIYYDGQESDGLRVGKNQVEYFATDMVGNKASVTVTLTVEI